MKCLIPPQFYQQQIKNRRHMFQRNKYEESEEDCLENHLVYSVYGGLRNVEGGKTKHLDIIINFDNGQEIIWSFNTKAAQLVQGKKYIRKGLVYNHKWQNVKPIQYDEIQKLIEYLATTGYRIGWNNCCDSAKAIFNYIDQKCECQGRGDKFPEIEFQQMMGKILEIFFNIISHEDRNK